MSAADDPAVAVEAQRQQLLLRHLWGRDDAPALASWLRDDAVRAERAVLAYRANAEAGAARALAIALPTLETLVGGEALRVIAARHWQRCPPPHGDLGLFGATLADALADDEALSEWPYVADLARLDWAVHACERAADAAVAVQGLERLGDTDPALLVLALRPGTAVVASRWPIVILHAAHRADAASGEDRIAAARAALDRGEAQTAIVWRTGWRAQVAAIDPPLARFTASLATVPTLAGALDAAGEGFDFEAWLLRALRDGWLAAVRVVDAPALPPDQ